MKCLIVQPVHDAGLALLRSNGIEPVPCSGTDAASIARSVQGCDAAITRDAGFPREAFEAADRLRAVVVHGTGHNAVDKEAAIERGVLVANTPGANAQSVAELTLGLALALARGVPGADRWERAGTPGFRESVSFRELSGKTVLVVGWGSIGSRFGQMAASAFGMKVLVHSPRARDIGGFIRVDSLEEGLAQADLVTLHTPLRPETHHMFNAARFAAMKPGAQLVNVARAELVDEAALAGALASGHLGGAALDVYSHGAGTGPLAAFSNVIFTPHLGGTTEEALRRVAMGAAGHVVTALTGGVPETVLTPVPQAQTAEASA
ncbi:NAD(P)-dependent oxidoreductase [Salipiger sp. PrR002]|uniref:NAD(P)-dependent oxidoreductase n=1 Tax=Salipiger sp. PrR002 TaxID=2706489 RepID=UPI0013BD8C69|nr:NAD(P)-dependent oxidoreductase [Salipiger sp. PrR002]NDW02643.1 3-phosphoglycerate dehydrogenase [Salipiger sp. PrR002]NDW59912.1 3-phosphoglycerate dehydrogenase [Salipiger sp. PrR004]